jgi:hypothetical protein
MFRNPSELSLYGFRVDLHHYHQFFHPRRAKVTTPFNNTRDVQYGTSEVVLHPYLLLQCRCPRE